MPRQRLEKLLGELHAELSGSSFDSAEDRAALAALGEEIREALGEDSSSDSSDGDGARFDSRIRESIERFEASHPTLAEILGGIVDQLARLGI